MARGQAKVTKDIRELNADNLRLPPDLAVNEDVTENIHVNEAQSVKADNISSKIALSNSNKATNDDKTDKEAKSNLSSEPLGAKTNNQLSCEAQKPIPSNFATNTVKKTTKRTTPKAKKRSRMDLIEEQIGRFFRTMMLFCGILFIFVMVVLVFWSQVLGSNQEQYFEKNKEIRDPGFFLANGHYTENNLRLNIMPKRFAGKRFPIIYNNDVRLERVTVGPGSVVTNYFTISENLAQKQTPTGVAQKLCGSKGLRTELIDMVDEYRLVYATKQKKLYKITLTQESCDSLVELK